MAAVLVYVTASSRDEAVRIARSVVEERLAACANILSDIASFYWWEGAVQEEREVALILKTRPERVDALIARVRELHGYTVPCIVALPIEKGNPAFLEWICRETGGSC
jgi:periplasmic divalent cation tolerance protein